MNGLTALHLYEAAHNPDPEVQKNFEDPAVLQRAAEIMKNYREEAAEMDNFIKEANEIISEAEAEPEKTEQEIFDEILLQEQERVADMFTKLKSSLNPDGDANTDEKIEEVKEEETKEEKEEEKVEEQEEVKEEE